MFKKILFSALLMWSVSMTAQTVPLNVFDELLESEWQGNLTYMDYSSEKEVVIPVNLKVKRIKEGTYQFAYIYPDEPKANSKSKIRISDDGSKLAGKKVVKAEQANELWTITTESKGEDNNEKASIRVTWTIGQKGFSTKKEVMYKDETTYFVRNEYVFFR